MQNANTILAILVESLESWMLGKLARPVRGGADGKGLEAGWPSLLKQTDK